ncbi:hypothetical protein [Leisingera sp. D0M16]|uniref:hypothetical protein n=1 Tax=Leisingera coralii TaxID=3351347 RepID=UPI003BA0D7A0
MTIRDYIEALGGYRAVAKRLGKRHTTVHTHMQAGALPAAWYDALCLMAHEKGIAEPPRSLFSFLTVERRAEAGEAAA